MDEGVRFAAEESLLHQATMSLGLEPLLKLLISDDEKSRRIKLRIIEEISRLGVQVPKTYLAAVEKCLLELSPTAKVNTQGIIRVSS